MPKQQPEHRFADKEITLTEQQRREIGAVVAVVFNDNEQLLVFKRNYRYGKNTDGIRIIEPITHEDFGLPGGQVDETDPTLESAVLRELAEETGLSGKEAFPVFNRIGRPNGTTICVAFVVNRIEGVLLPNSNILDYNPLTEQSVYEGHAEWVSPAKLLNPSFYYYDYNKALLEYLGL